MTLEPRAERHLPPRAYASRSTTSLPPHNDERKAEQEAKVQAAGGKQVPHPPSGTSATTRPSALSHVGFTAVAGTGTSQGSDSGPGSFRRSGSCRSSGERGRGRPEVQAPKMLLQAKHAHWRGAERQPA